MKTLLLMRHAKSSWKFPELSDHDRPLNKRGRRDAPLMGTLLVDRELVPQRILCSSAIRARQTAEAVAETAGFKGEMIFQDRLYMAEAEDYLEAIRQQPDSIERIMIIGHNPGLETLLQMLSNRIESLPTAVIAHIAIPVQHWADINADTTGELVDIWRPKELREGAEEEEHEKEKGKGKSKSKDKHKSKKKDK